jgi:hypothetical protein
MDSAVNLWGKKLESVFAQVLGMVHGDICVLQEMIKRITIIRIHNDTDAR